MIFKLTIFRNYLSCFYWSTSSEIKCFVKQKSNASNPTSLKINQSINYRICSKKCIIEPSQASTFTNTTLFVLILQVIFIFTDSIKTTLNYFLIKNTNKLSDYYELYRETSMLKCIQIFHGSVIGNYYI